MITWAQQDTDNRSGVMEVLSLRSEGIVDEIHEEIAVTHESG